MSIKKALHACMVSLSGGMDRRGELLKQRQKALPIPLIKEFRLQVVLKGYMQ
jgi:hypothetical protein